MSFSDYTFNVGQALIFLMSLAGLGIVGPLWLAYGSHALLVIVTESSLGDPEVRWPDESVMDWWWKPIYCLVLLSFWLTGGAACLGWLMLYSPWAFGVCIGLFLWYAYPLGLLCVMDAQNSWAVVYFPLILRLLRQPVAVLLVGLATLPLGVAVAVLVWLFLRHGFAWVIGLAFVVPITVLLYARGWGRLAWMVLNVRERKERAKVEKPPAEAKDVIVHDPWAAPPSAPREEIPELEVEVEEPEPPDPGDEEWAVNPQPYGVPTKSAGEVETGPFSHDEYYAGYRKREAARQARAEGRSPEVKRRRRRGTIRNLFGPDFWAFLGDHRTLRVGVGMGLLTLVSCALVRIILEMFPTGVG